MSSSFLRLQHLCRLLILGNAGNVALLFCLVIPILIGLTGFALDAAGYARQLGKIQSIADASSLAVANELHLYRRDIEELREVGKARVGAMIADSSYAGESYNVAIGVDPDQNLIDVTIDMPAKNFLSVDLGYFSKVEAKSTAQAYGLSRLCILTLDPSAPRALKADGGSSITAPECAVHSNSTAPNGLDVAPDSHLISTQICSSGGFGPKGNYDPTPEPDCPRLDDPLSLRPRPSVGGCNFLDTHIDKEKVSIGPGTYCGGLKITGGAEVIAEAGTYIFTGGNLEVKDKSKLVGEHTSFFFDDEASSLNFDKDTTIDLSASKEGDMAGILIFENPAIPKGHDFTIRSENAKRLLGTIYLPTAKLMIDSKSAVAAESAYTVIVAQQLDVKGAELIVNSDYGGTDVPVPKGLGPTSTMSRLTR